MDQPLWTTRFQAFFVAAMLSAAVMELARINVSVMLPASFAFGVAAAIVASAIVGAKTSWFKRNRAASRSPNFVTDGPPKERVEVASWNYMSMPLTSLARIVNDAMASIPPEYLAKTEVTHWDGVYRIVYYREITPSQDTSP